ncbi:Type IV secretion system protein virB6, partial [Xanthomonas nasturtii]|nr:Type IV secretion system protein virB6 [Xanthomonas nasturtii]MCL1536481.1 Type IV secretion system protein virB6 [Xanthomonas nasturtii]MCL1545722.1 Type IV secretion system protein virB6 [Xanthomonas nasturtii]
LIMTMLIITVPTIAAALWQGNMGTFLSYTAFNSAASPGPQGQPAGSYMPQQIGRNSNQISDRDSVAAPQQQGRAIGYATSPEPIQVAGSRGNAIRNDGSNS